MLELQGVEQSLGVNVRGVCLRGRKATPWLVERPLRPLHPPPTRIGPPISRVGFFSVSEDAASERRAQIASRLSSTDSVSWFISTGIFRKKYCHEKSFMLCSGLPSVTVLTHVPSYSTHTRSSNRLLHACDHANIVAHTENKHTEESKTLRQISRTERLDLIECNIQGAEFAQFTDTAEAIEQVIRQIQKL